MKSIHNTTQHQQSVGVTDGTSDTLLCAHTLAQPVCTTADSPTANSGRGIMNTRRILWGRWRSIAVLTVFAAMIAVCIAPTLAAWAGATLTFGDPTPDNGATICDNHATINVSIATDDLTYFAFNWDGTNYTYTTCGATWDGSASTLLGRTTTVGSYDDPADFDNIFPWSHIRRCTLQDDGTVNYYLNATDSSFKATGGLADLTGGAGQVMVEIPKFYVNHTYISGTHGWNISRFDLPDFTVHDAFMKNGTEVDYRYIGAYEGSDDNGKLCSVSEAYPTTNKPRSEFRTMARARNGGWRQQDFDLISAVQLLYLIEYADFDSQSTIGVGRTQGQELGQCGKSNSDGDGTNSATGDDAYMTYRGIENFYGNVWTWVDGINIYNNCEPYVCNNDAFWSDTTIENYTDLGVTLTVTEGYQTALADTDRGFLPTATAGSASAYICDYYLPTTPSIAVALGGSKADTTKAGAFCIYAGSGLAYPSIGGRLAY